MTLRFALVGRRSHRTPLSYNVYQQLLPSALRRVDAFRSPDLLVFGHPDDIREEAATVATAKAFSPGVKLVVLSEEPFWDLNRDVSCLDREGTIETAEGSFRFSYLNHETTDIFHFHQLPYYITTDDDFLARYRHLMSQHVGQTVRSTLERWENARHQAAFFAEKRINEKFDKSIESRDIYGLSRFRSMLTYHYDAPGTLKVGRGWVKGAAKRQALPDWHLDKLEQLNGRSRLVSAIENTHQHHYITEKLLDAYAVGGVPLYYASPTHRVHELTPNASFVNLYGYTHESACDWLTSFELTPAFAGRYLEDLRELLARLTGAALIAERDRVLKEVVKEFENCVNAD